MNRSIAKLKEKARIHEQNEEWGEAIIAYQQALKIAEEGEGELELSLFNRIGDLFMRDGKEGDALRYYELAADHYEEAGLYNSAIALCNKVLRHDPHRPDPYYKLGRLSLAQGFISEARRWSVEYAERMLRAGKRREAFAALDEFASHAADPEIRELLAQYLLAHDETAEALTQLLAAYHARLEAGQTDQANELREKILTIDPDADLDPPSEPPAEDPGSEGDDVPLEIQTAADSAGLGGAGPTLIAADEVNIGIALIDASPDAGPGEGTDPEPGPVLEIPEEPASPEEHGLLDLDLESVELGGGEDEEEPPPLPLLGEPEPPPAAALPVEVEPVEVEPVEAEPIEIDPIDIEPVEDGEGALLSEPRPPAAGDGFVDLGELLFGDEETEQGLTRYVVDTPAPSGDEDQDFLDLLSQFKEKVSEHLGDEDADSRYDLGLAFKEMGLYDEAIAQFQIALRGLGDQLRIYEELGDCFIQKGEYGVALKILKGALQRSSSGGSEFIGVYYQLGRSYEELGRVEEARDAYERVIALDLEFRDASARLARL